MSLAPHRIIQHSPPDTSYGFRRCCEAVRNAVPIEGVARRYTELEQFGRKAWFTGRCPLPDHEDKTPSFYIYPPDHWWCYGCGRGGDVVDLEFHCGDYGELWEAMISLAVEYDVELPERPPSWLRRQERQKPVRPRRGQGSPRPAAAISHLRGRHRAHRGRDGAAIGEGAHLARSTGRGGPHCGREAH
jgi:hypothetical protein